MSSATTPQWLGRIAVATLGVFAPARIYYPGAGAFYDASDGWGRFVGMPLLRERFAVAVLDDKIYTIGGYTFFITWTPTDYYINNMTPLDSVEVYTPFGYGTVPPQVSIIVPSENVVFLSGGVPLNFTIDRSVVSVSYSLDGEPGVGLLGNVTLCGLSVGVHNVSVCVVDGFGNVGVSDVWVFSVVESFWVGFVVVGVLLVVVVLVVLGGIILLKRHR